MIGALFLNAMKFFKIRKYTEILFVFMGVAELVANLFFFFLFVVFLNEHGLCS